MSAPTPLDIARRALAPALGNSFRSRYEQGVRCSGMTPQTRLVALTLASLSSATGAIEDSDQPGLLGLVEATGLSAGRVAVQLRVLESRGWLLPLRGARYETARLQLALPQHVAVRLRN